MRKLSGCWRHRRLDAVGPGTAVLAVIAAVGVGGCWSGAIAPTRVTRTESGMYVIRERACQRQAPKRVLRARLRRDPIRSAARQLGLPATRPRLHEVDVLGHDQCALRGHPAVVRGPRVWVLAGAITRPRVRSRGSPRHSHVVPDGLLRQSENGEVRRVLDRFDRVSDGQGVTAWDAPKGGRSARRRSPVRPRVNRHRPPYTNCVIVHRERGL